MPIKIPNDLPASKILKEENIFVMDETRALSQRIRPLKLIIVNIMPTKIVTETQLLRLLSNTPLQIEVDWLCMESHNSKNTPQEHLQRFLIGPIHMSFHHFLFVGLLKQHFIIIMVSKNMNLKKS